ncbi:MAG: TetR family transcriptional regulator [Sphingomonadales bacterium]|nr:TetR family transcriptional regulator [Sphingomonadales bacterium]
MRQVAILAGLSRQAPYNHFADKEALLAALALDGFNELEGALRSSIADVNPLAAVADAYIGFAQRSPALFRLMFSRELVDLGKFPDAADAAKQAFGTLASVIVSLTSAERVEELTLAAWSLVHGYATLCNEAAIEGSDLRGARSRLFASIIIASAT